MEVKIATVLSARAARFLSQKLSGQSAKIATSFKLTTNARKRCACKILSIRMVQIYAPQGTFIRETICT